MFHEQEVEEICLQRNVTTLVTCLLTVFQLVIESATSILYNVQCRKENLANLQKIDFIGVSYTSINYDSLSRLFLNDPLKGKTVPSVNKDTESVELGSTSSSEGIKSVAFDDLKSQCCEYFFFKFFVFSSAPHFS